jgi:hypothetical protein
MPVTIPPERFDHAYDGVVIEKLLTLEETRKLCTAIGVGPYDGCAGYISLEDGTKACLIILPTDGFDSVEAYRRHEISHCNGWPANHPPE